VDKIKLEIVI